MKKLTAFFFLMLVTYTTIAQVGIGTTNPDASTVLDIYSDNKGILLPRVTTIDRDAIPNPPNGLILYNTTTKSLNYFDVVWKDFSPGY